MKNCVRTPWQDVLNIPNLENNFSSISQNIPGLDYNKYIQHVLSLSELTKGYIIYIPTEDNSDIEGILNCVLSIDEGLNLTLFELNIWINPEYSSMRNLILLSQESEKIAKEYNAKYIQAGCYATAHNYERYTKFLQHRGYKLLGTQYQKEV